MSELTTVRLHSHVLTVAPKMPFRVKSDGKVKTDLSVLAKARPQYSCGKVEKQLISDVDLFKRNKPHALQKLETVAETVNLSEYNTVNRLLTAILLFKKHSYVDVKRDLSLFPLRRQAVVERMQQWLAEATHPGRKSTLRATIGRLRNKKPYVTYSVNTQVIATLWDDREQCHVTVGFNVGRITVKRTHEDGVFFDSKCCRRMRENLKRLSAAIDGYKLIDL